MTHDEREAYQGDEQDYLHKQSLRTAAATSHNVEYDSCQAWAMAHSRGTPRPFICAMVGNTRKQLIQRIEREICGTGEWPKWSRKTGARIVRCRIEQGAWP